MYYVCNPDCLPCIVFVSLTAYSALCLPVYYPLCLPVCLCTLHCVCLFTVHCVFLTACLQHIVSVYLPVYSALCLPVCLFTLQRVCLLILKLFPLAWFPPFFFPDFPVIVIAQVPPLPPSSPPPPGGETGWKVVSQYHQQLDTKSRQKRYDGWVVIYQMDGAAFLDSNLSFQCKKNLWIL